MTASRGSQKMGSAIETGGLARRGPNSKRLPDRANKSQRKQHEMDEIDSLVERIQKGIQFSEAPSKFSELPISSRTLRGLEECHFLEMTDIQKCALPIALSELDVMGAAKTGSGKTLAFLIPALERLYREKWGIHDGLGALILSPTRELALQTFEVLKRIGKYHGLSAGLVIGGKDLKSEQEAIARMNILIATPGRLLQHMDQTSTFEWNNLKVLIFDEADRILDLGFARTIDAILEELPKDDRQTMLFSATQTNAIDALARLSLQDPVQMSVHNEQVNATPDKLTQKYLICPLESKLDYLYSFIKSNLKSKIIVFLSSCKQVRFVYEAFCQLQPGMSLLHLHGRQKQSKRMLIYQEFCRKPSACLFATDVAARGLDFPAVNWVIQADCPEDVETYIHRVGRTARFDQAGNGLLYLLPSEKKFVDLLKERKVPITSLYNDNREAPPAKRPIKSQLQALCSQDPEIKYLAQKALVSYVRSVFLHGNKEIFKVEELPVDAFAAGLGLANTPRLRFAEKSIAKNRSRQEAAALVSSDDENENENKSSSSNNLNSTTKTIVTINKKQTNSKIDKIFNRKNKNVLSDHYAKLREDININDESSNDNNKKNKKKNDDDDDDLFKIKRKDHEINPEEMIPIKQAPSKTARRDVLKTRKKYTLKNAPTATRLIFDDEGESREAFPFKPEASFNRKEAERMAETFVKDELASMEVIDREDAERQKQARRTLRVEKKRKIRDQLENIQSKAPRIG